MCSIETSMEMALIYALSSVQREYLGKAIPVKEVNYHQD